MLKRIHTKTISDSQINDDIEEFYNDTKISINIIDCNSKNCANITFICLINDIKYLAIGYLASIGIVKIADIAIQDDNITICLDMTKEAILEHLRQKEIIQTCESIHIIDTKNTQDNIIVPFNGSKHTLKISEILHYARFYDNNPNNNLHSDNLRICRIIKDGNIIESSDINAKNAIYKAIGKAIDKSYDLLDSILMIHWTLDLEVLKKILCCKITFVMFIGKPSFYVLKYAQKFGITLIEYKNNDTLSILTHQVRIK